VRWKGRKSAPLQKERAKGRKSVRKKEEEEEIHKRGK
jgi:hypothetical protein